MKRRAVVVARVSSEEQANDDRISLRHQLTETRRYAEQRGYEVIGEYVEPGVSGAAKLDARPVIQRLLREEGFDAAVWLKFDRLSRSTLIGLQIMQALEQRGVTVLSVQEPLDPGTPEGRLFRQQLLSFAEFERERIRERTVTGRRARAAVGRWPGGAVPFGVDVDDTGRLVINKREATAIKRAATLLARGGTTGDVARLWNEAGLRSKMRSTVWTAGMVRRLFAQDRLSAGVHNFWGHDLPHPVIITPDLHARVRKSLRQAAVRRGAHGGRLNVYPLSGRIICPCEGKMVGFQARGIRYYRCQRRYGQPGCDSEVIKLLRAQEVEDRAWNSLMHILGGRNEDGEPDWEVLKAAAVAELDVEDVTDELLAARRDYERSEEAIAGLIADQRLADDPAQAQRLGGAIKRIDARQAKLAERINQLQHLSDDQEASRGLRDAWVQAAARVAKLRGTVDPKVRLRVFTDLDVTVELVLPSDWPQVDWLPWPEGWRYYPRVHGVLDPWVVFEDRPTG